MIVASAAHFSEIEGGALGPVATKIDTWVAEANGESPFALAPSPGSSLARPAATILVVDDQSGIGRMTQNILELAGYVVLRTSDPLEALALSNQRPADIDLLLADMSMPPMPGKC
jgi:PleD family two-component response regulator